MTRKHQIELLENFLNAMKAQLLRTATDFPEEWDGFEIRQFVADSFVRETHKMPAGRMHAYRNAARKIL